MQTPSQKTILILASNPQSMANLDLLPEIRKLEEVLQRSKHRDRFVVKWKVAQYQSDLRKYIQDTNPKIVHLCGHGTQQGLMLENMNRRPIVVPNEFLVDLLKEFADRIECIHLNSCNTEPLATALVEHLNYAIGMNREVRDDAAIAFSEAFYRALGEGKFYEAAFALGGNAQLLTVLME